MSAKHEVARMSAKHEVARMSAKHEDNRDSAKHMGTTEWFNKKKYMSTYTQILYQIVFSTKKRDRTLIEKDRERLFHFIWGILEKKNCHLYRIGGVEDHIHIVMHLHPAISLSNLVKDIKLATCDFIKSNNVLPDFSGWQEGYGAFTYDVSSKNNLIRYVKNQKEHHRKHNFRDEYMQLLKDHGVDFDEKYLF